MKKVTKIHEAEVQNFVSLKKRSLKKYTIYAGVLIVVLLLSTCSIIQVSVSNNLTTEGTTLAKIQDKIDAVKKENMLLSEQLYTMSSYTHIASQAAMVGFVEGKQAIFLSEPGTLAIKP